jgi:hypothetical protein
MSIVIASRNGLKGSAQQSPVRLPTRIRVYVTCEIVPDDPSGSHLVKDVLLMHQKFLFDDGRRYSVDFLSRNFKRIALPCIGIIVAIPKSRQEQEWQELFQLFQSKAGLPAKIPTHVVRPDCATIIGARKSVADEHRPLGLRSGIKGCLHQLEVSKLIDRDEVITLPELRQPLPGPFAPDPLR